MRLPEGLVEVICDRLIKRIPADYTGRAKVQVRKGNMTVTLESKQGRTTRVHPNAHVDLSVDFTQGMITDFTFGN